MSACSSSPSLLECVALLVVSDVALCHVCVCACVRVYVCVCVCVCTCVCVCVCDLHELTVQLCPSLLSGSLRKIQSVSSLPLVLQLKPQAPAVGVGEREWVHLK